MNLFLYSDLTQKMYFLLPICSNYTLIDPNLDYSTSHIHPVYHLMFVTNGSGTVQSDSTVYSLKERDIAVIHPNRKHVFASTDRIGMTFFSFNFYLIPQNAYQLLSKTENWCKDTNYPTINQYAETLPLDEVFELHMQDIRIRYQETNWESIMDEVRRFSKRSVQFFDNLVPPLFQQSYEAVHTFCGQSVKFLWNLFMLLRLPESDDDMLQNDPLLQSIIDFLKDNIYEKYSLSNMAEKLNYSSVYLCTYFSQKTGTTINNYFNYLKISRACNYLRTTSKSITEISEILNFSSPNHFSKNFSKIKGVSPKYYQKHLEIV